MRLSHTARGRDECVWMGEAVVIATASTAGVTVSDSPGAQGRSTK